MSETRMPKEHFTIKYDGESLRQHEMDVAVLAPALMAMSEIVKHISKAISDGQYTATLNVKGNIKSGSIEIELSTQAVSLIDQMRDMLVGQSATAWSNLFGIAGGVSGIIGTLLYLIKRHKGATPSHAERVGDDIRLIFNQQSEIVNVHIYQLYVNYDIRQAIYDSLKPLEIDGIDEFSLIQADKLVIHITDTELPYFAPNNISKPLTDNTTLKTLVIESITFKEKNKWSFHDGQNSIRAIISDDVFLTAIDKGEIRFAKGDWLNVEIRTLQIEENGKLKTTYEIIKVVEHIKREQYKLDI